MGHSSDFTHHSVHSSGEWVVHSLTNESRFFCSSWDFCLWIKSKCYLKKYSKCVNIRFKYYWCMVSRLLPAQCKLLRVLLRTLEISQLFVEKEALLGGSKTSVPRLLTIFLLNKQFIITLTVCLGTTDILADVQKSLGILNFFRSALKCLWVFFLFIYFYPCQKSKNIQTLSKKKQALLKICYSDKKIK